VALRASDSLAPTRLGPEPGPLGAFGASRAGGLEAIFPPIADYAFLSDCENTCLVAPTGSVEWLCLPKPYDPSVFGTVLDRTAGSFRLAPADTAVPANRRYVPGTMVLATTWRTRTGWLAIRDFLAIGPWHRTTDRSTLHRRTPGDFDAQHDLVRTATCLDGTVDVVLDCEPSFDSGRVGQRESERGRSTGASRPVSTSSQRSCKSGWTNSTRPRSARLRPRMCGGH
jgi:GH15 family glucan-1,4-alpha-glucosidase